MNRIIQVLMVLVVSSLGLFAQVDLSICTYNVKSFEGNPALPSGQSFDMPFFVDALKPLDLDIIGINELEINSSRMGERNLLSVLGEGLGMYSTFGFSYVKEKGVDGHPDALYGNGLLSRYPILNSSSKQLVKPAGSSDQRSVLFADILHPSGKVIRVVVTHLDHQSGQLEQLQDILTDDRVAKSPYPLLLMGDFNASYYGSIQGQLSDNFSFVSDPNTPTYSGWSVIDFILAAPKASWESVSHQTHQEITYSDHSPVVAKIRLK